MEQKREHPKEKPGLHPRNLHRQRYDLNALVQTCKELEAFVIRNKFQDDSVDFFNPQAVKMLNKALLKHFYGINQWDIPPGYLCPPIPGRADYLHYAADLLALGNNGMIPTGKTIRCLDIGVGANCIYPLIGNSTYGWSFVGSDIDSVAIDNASEIIGKNPTLQDAIEVRLQKNPDKIFAGIMQPNEHFDLTICNPPFHCTATEANLGAQRKLNNLKREKNSKPILNFGGQNNELWCRGGEVHFVNRMILQSKEIPNTLTWFTTLISKSEHLSAAIKTLKWIDAIEIKTISMAQGNKISRILAWHF